MHKIKVILSIILGLASFTSISANAQGALTSPNDSAAAHHTQVKLVLSADAAKPGEKIWAGVDLKMEAGWHTYWKNPGAAGQATEIKWQLPPGVTAGDIQWPLPQKLPPAEVTTYGYEGEVLLLVPLTFDKNISSGELNLTAKVSWLECRESCIPASADVKIKINIGNETKMSTAADTIETWKKKQPRTANNFFEPTIQWRQSAVGNQRSLGFELNWLKPNSKILPENVDFYPYASDDFEIQADKLTVTNSPVRLGFSKLVKKFSGDWPREIFGVFVVQNGDARTGYEIKLPVGEPASVDSAKATTTAVIAPPPAIWRMLIYAFIGGLILNIMPCVLPVIALKILGFVSEAKSDPRHVRKLGLIYTLGVLFSFLALAAVIIGVKAAGHKAGWGMQFGNPIFLVCLVTLVTLVAMNLFGIFEVTLGGGAMDAAGGLASKHGAAGAFFNGVLATALATPCTAPFLSIALGFAFAQGATLILLIFLSVGLGLASPYLVLSWNPAWLKFLPKPGAWMEKFKMAMAFPMLLTVVWLFNLAAENYGDRVLWLGIFLVMVAFALWIYGEFVQRGQKHQTLATIVVLILLGAAYTFALEKELRWREPLMPKQIKNLANDSSGILWQPWSAQAVNEARSTGQPVLVDFTADWCLTCQVNKKTSIEDAAVREKINSLHVVTLLGDYTHFPDAITTELNRFNRAGVPLVLVYPKDRNAAPLVLPEVLTPGIMLDALEKAAK